MEKKIKGVLILPREKEPQVVEIENSLKGLQTVVEGYIENIGPFPGEGNVVLLCNEEGKLHGMKLNRVLVNQTMDYADTIRGPIFVCGTDGEDYCSLTADQLEDWMKRGRLFSLKVGGDI